jgi:transcriptional regulator with XRE-family HTH domain
MRQFDESGHLSTAKERAPATPGLKVRQIDLPLTRLALEAQVSRSFVYDILYGRSQNPTKPKLERLADCLRVGVDWLVTGHGFVEGVEPGREGDALYVTIRSAKVTPSMGGGRMVEEVDEGESLRFLARWVRETFKVQPDDLRIMRVEGDSMEPTLLDQDTVIVDLTKKTPSPPGIFVLHDGMGLVAKRVEIVPRSDPLRLRIVSDNSRYAAYDVTVDEANIVGRIRWFCREL